MIWLNILDSYDERAMGEHHSVESELCQVWSIRLEGIDMRSSRVPRATTAVADDKKVPRSVSENVYRTGSHLLQDASCAEDVTIEVSVATMPQSLLFTAVLFFSSQ